MLRSRRTLFVSRPPSTPLQVMSLCPSSRRSFFQEACCAYVLIVTAVYWVSEAVPLGAAALVPAFLYPLFGVLKSSEVSLMTHNDFVYTQTTRKRGKHLTQVCVRIHFDV